MEIRLRQRLIGAAVLIGLAGVFLPWLFKMLINTTPSKKFVAPSAVMPKPPAIPKIKETVIVLPDNQTITLTSSVTSGDSNAEPHVNIKHAPEATPGLDPVEFKPLAASQTDKNAIIEPGKAWVVEVGTFADEAHAQALLKQLQTLGFTAYTLTRQTANGKLLTRVLVGPEAKHMQAEKLLQQLDKELHLKGAIVAFHPAA